MRMKIDLPMVRECSASACAYNAELRCHAKAITVGDDAHPACDTFLPSPRHTLGSTIAGVGACKVSSCKHNRDLECAAESVRVGIHEGHADCLTFERA